MNRLETIYYFARGVSRAIRRGDLFPAAGRVAPVAAPSGSRVVVSGAGGVNESHRFEVTEHKISLGTAPLRILHLSDVHLRDLDAWTQSLAKRVRDFEVDLVVLTGDTLTRGWTDAAVDVFLRALPRARLGCFAVMGNWEYWGGAPAALWTSKLAQYGVELLHNRAIQRGDFYLVGTDDALAGAPDLEAAFEGVPAGVPVVVLTHSPILFPELVARHAGPMLVLAGHTHGGQVRFPLVGPFFLPKGSGNYPWAWYRQAHAWMFVSRGLGWSVGPWRWKAPPEIALIDIAG